MEKKIKESSDNQALASRKKMFQILGLCIVLLSFLVFVYWYFIGSKHITTDNAYVGAEMALVTPAIDGIIRDVPVVDTQHVSKGDILVVIDDTDTKLALQQAQAEYNRTEAERDRTKLVFDRRKALSNSAVSAEELSNAKNAYKVAESAFMAAQAHLDQAKINLERTIIRSPIDGVVAKRQVQLGQHISAGDNLMTVVPIQEVHIDANFKEVELRKIKIGHSVEVTSDIYGSSVVYHGKVAGFSGGTGSVFALIPAQNATGNWIKVVQRLPVRITLDKEELEKNPLRVGLSMHVDINVASLPS